jgi:acetyl-CoA/propionyl-CoA carboxylase biotin carboxyl carrier protein
MEFRINAEDPAENFEPDTGTLETYDPPGGIGVRVDDAIHQGDTISGDYDSMIGKLIVHGSDREECLARSRRAFDDFDLEGLSTTIPFHRLMLTDDTVVEGTHSTKYLDETLDSDRLESAKEQWGTDSDSSSEGDEYVSQDFVVELDGRRHDMTLHGKMDEGSLLKQAASAAPQEGSAQSATATSTTESDGAEESGGGFLGGDDAGDSSPSLSTNGKDIEAEMQGTILSVDVEPGDKIESGDVVCVLEAMKMENDIVSQHNGKVTDVNIEEGESVDMGDLLISLE